jgi:iron complex transport system substrate-binding protein
MTKRVWTGMWVLLSMVLLLGLVAAAQQYPVTVIDNRGLEIRIEQQPNRIVVAGIPLYTEIMVDLGAVDRLVAVASSPDNPPEVAGLPRVGESFAPNVEVILSMGPDLVLGASDWAGERTRLEKLGITVLSVGRVGGSISTVPDILTAINTIGTALGVEEEARLLIGQIAEEIITIESTVLTEPPVRAAFLYAMASDIPPYAVGSGSIENELIIRAGGVNVFSDIEGFPQVSFEEILSRDPDVIFTDPTQIVNILENPLFAGVSAVVKKKVYGINARHLLSTKVARALRTMSEFLHPHE